MTLSKTLTSKNTLLKSLTSEKKEAEAKLSSITSMKITGLKSPVAPLKNSIKTMDSKPMANLKGGSLQKQAKDGFHRLQAFGKGRVGKEDHLTHSDKLAEKREMYFRDMVSYMERNEIEGKLNHLMNQENLNGFLSERLENLATKTQEDYLCGLSSMLQGLHEQNIYIPLHVENKDYFDDYVSQIKQDQPDAIIENRYIDNVDMMINVLYEDRYITGLIAQTQYELGIRQAEAFELVQNPEKYIDDGIISNLIGKGNHAYEPKQIPFELEQRILNYQGGFIDKSTYYRDLHKYDISSHDFRFTHARNSYEEKMASGMSEQQAKLEVSEELNHKREAITDYYLTRTT